MGVSHNDLGGSVTSFCVRLSKVSKVEGEKVPSGHFEIEMAFFGNRAKFELHRRRLLVRLWYTCSDYSCTLDVKRRGESNFGKVKCEI